MLDVFSLCDEVVELSPTNISLVVLPGHYRVRHAYLRGNHLYADFCLKGLWKTKKIFIQDNPCTGPDSNRSPLQYKPTALPLSFCSRSVVFASRSLSIIQFSITLNNWRLVKKELEKWNAEIMADKRHSLGTKWRRAGQFHLTGGPNNSSSTGLRATLVPTYIEKWGVGWNLINYKAVIYKQ